MDSNLKGKRDKRLRLAKCQRLQAPKVKPEIWLKLPHQAKQQDLPIANIQKTLAKGGLTLAIKPRSSTKAPLDFDRFMTSNMDALAFLGHISISCMKSGGMPFLLGDDLQTQ